MLARSIFLTGCSRGLGLEMVKQIHPFTETLIATCRNPETASELRELAEEHSHIKILPVDVLNHETFGDVAEEVSSIVGEQGLNLLINNAGISPRSTRINFVTPEAMAETFAVNTTSPLMLTKALLPLLKAGASSDVDEDSDFCIKNAAIVNISSVLGSISNNMGDRSGGLYPYRCSKAALNMVTRSLSSDLNPFNITVISIHPGWVRTDMGGPNAPLSSQESIESLISTLKELTFDKSGLFFNQNGEEIPW
ncbi:hypothetical protein DAPPUDRAFT_309362 [Daphnia pulex]|uniref:C-factor n=1 Tax=Daphnia pulex TaxID=6669 RepID=E9HCE9_DAPPU|nr:hypothetical protein DAPPUDRAFT_309362 [Daphnia pulex]|eukprot:EFX70608.1 hypothetical protein DAPPUDRAFT_309362 [Daphnia pulex]